MIYLHLIIILLLNIYLLLHLSGHDKKCIIKIQHVQFRYIHLIIELLGMPEGYLRENYFTSGRKFEKKNDGT